VDDRSGDLYSQVPPPCRYTVACVLVADVESTDDGDSLVRDNKFAMIAKCDSQHARRIEEAQLRAARQRLREKILRQLARTEIIEKNSSANAAPDGVEQRLAYPSARLVAPKDVHLEADGLRGIDDQRLDRVDGGGAGV
jgi:hypothetical protein